ncbi:integral membrane protein [Stemphylium lycopersici]|uniref:Integral membrane protein n=1 Tax=Stemphylium lycopersici TaxID=183478 RepID=A0A364N991_STELY|nr:integral membrane protein [Stemphylium lycopersici]RAR00672.1 integral membrane protein [Stemphylium lycopersici]RAR13836.1 integral membrane protein [Stemphylium lycopersici]
MRYFPVHQILIWSRDALGAVDYHIPTPCSPWNCHRVYAETWVGGLLLKYSGGRSPVIAAVFLSIAFYNFLELNIYIFTSFKRRSGLYFWSFTVSTWGIAFNSIGYTLMHLGQIQEKNIFATFILVGWCMMITGQSVVLYSRLHIVMHNLRWLKYVLFMIITNAIWLHIPIIILVYGANSSYPEPFVGPYRIYERIQLSVFIAQELVISGLYVYETTKLLRLERTIGNLGTRSLLHHLLWVNALVILLDFSILGLEFADLFEIQTSWKPLVYSIKLKLEFSILNRLVKLTKTARSGNASSYSNNAIRSGGLALGTLRGKSAIRRSILATGIDDNDQWEVHVGSGKPNDGSDPAHVVKTTEFTVQSHSRQESRESLFESGKEALAHSATHDTQEVERGSASSVSSDPQYGRYHEHQQNWQ